MTHRPFPFERSLPELGPDFPPAIAALLAECEAELAVVNALSPLSLEEMSGQGRLQTDALKVQYFAEGRYSEAFLERRSDLSRHLYRLFKIKTAWLKELRTVPTPTLSGDLLTERQQKLAWWNEAAGGRWSRFKRIKSDLAELDPSPVEQRGRRNGDCPPDTLSDGLSQGIGVRQYL